MRWPLPAAEGSKQVTPAKSTRLPRQGCATHRSATLGDHQPLTENRGERHQLSAEEEGILPSDVMKDRVSPFGGKNQTIWQVARLLRRVSVGCYSKLPTFSCPFLSSRRYGEIIETNDEGIVRTSKRTDQNNSKEL